METKEKSTKVVAGILALAGLLALCPLAMTGDLEPSAPPGPTMKTLEEVEPRTPISSAPYTISQSGSYYLTNNLTGTITISADNVTLDLMGYTITAANGIISPSPSRSNMLVRNGVLRPSNVGLDVRYLSDDSNCRFENLRVEGNGSNWAGMFVGGGCVVENCQVRSNDDYGINVSNAGNTEIHNCVITDNAQVGLQAVNNTRITDNVIEGNGADGLKLTGSGCYIANNIVKGNADNYNLAADNELNILLCEIPETIEQPAMVTLSGSLKGVSGQNGITIDSNNVTIDLGGHTLQGVAGSECGIYMLDRSNVEIRNGTVRDFGQEGILEDGFYSRGHRIINMRIISNGQTSSSYGIFLYGLRNLVKGCTVVSNTSDGIYVGGGDTVTENICYLNSSAGINAGNGSIVSHNLCYDNTGSGISVGAGSTVTGNTAYSNDGSGIALGQYCAVDQNTTYSNGGTNMSLTRTGCVYGVNVAP